MKSSLRWRKSHAYVLNKDDIEKIWNTLSSGNNKVSAVLKFSDNIDRQTNSLDEIFKFENHGKKQITEIEFKSISEDRENIYRVSFYSNNSRTIEIVADGEDDTITKTSEKLEHITDGLKPWYSFICKIDFTLLFVIIFVLFFMIVMTMSPEKKEPTPRSFKESVEIVSILVFSLLTLTGIWWLIRKAMKYVFPTEAFSIGRGSESYRVKENIRWGVVVAFIISILASSFYSLIS